MKILVSISMIFLVACCEPSTDIKSSATKNPIDVGQCHNSISLEGYGMSHKFYRNPDTIGLNSYSYIIATLLDCAGGMDFKEFSTDSGLVLIGHYKVVEVLEIY